MAKIVNFPHRPNEDGTFDSICPHCFATVVSHAPASSLESLEEVHLCHDFAEKKDVQTIPKQPTRTRVVGSTD